MNKKLNRLLQPNTMMYYIILVFFIAASVAFRQYDLAIIEGLVLLLTFVILRFHRRRRRKALAEYVSTACESPEAISAIPFPAVLLQPQSSEILWYNKQFQNIAGLKDRPNPYHFSELFPNNSLTWLHEGKLEAPEPLVLETQRYRVSGSLIQPEDSPEVALAALYLVDETQLLLLKDEYTASRPVVSVILVDNYDELTNNLPDSNVSNLNAAIDTRIKYWTDGIGGLLRKVERNRYLFIFEVRNLHTAVTQKFSILESIRTITNPKGIHATISLGIGVDGANFAEGYTFANLAIEMALARGGDQAVIKDRNHFTFYGGRNKETERRTTVKARVTANSLSELIKQSSHVFIMGHKNADLDSVGAACGVACICRKLGKKPQIVIDRERNASQTLLKKLERQQEYKGCFISGQDALLMADTKSLLIVVDTNRPDQLECKPLLECVSRICVIDHHRRAADYIDTEAAISLHDPFASSASELVTELLQYAVDASDLLPIEAQALLSGIVLDTKNFGMRTSSKTFEAAAFLRRLGADTVDVKMILQNDKETTLERYRIVQEAQIYRDHIAIAALTMPTSRIVAAQAADELLTLTGVTTSFVMYPDTATEQVIISARSFGDTNVQMILEPLGGGGNAAIAGAQVKDKPTATVLTELIASIDQYFEAS